MQPILANLCRAVLATVAAAVTAGAMLGPAAPAQAADCPGANARPGAGNLAQVRDATLCLVNAERRPHGLRPLRENAMLTEASQAYSERMVSQRFFAHVAPDGATLTARLDATGYLAQPGTWVIGENIAWGESYLASPAKTVKAWMESPPHRANILNHDFEEIGLGIVSGVPPSSNAGATYTTDFGVVRPYTSHARRSHTAERKRKARTSCAALRRAKAHRKISRAARKRLARCNRKRAHG